MPNGLVARSLRSDVQIVAATVRIKTSRGPGRGVGRRVSASSPHPRVWSACIVDGTFIGS